MDNRFSKDKDVRIISETNCHEGFFKITKYELQHRLFSGGWSQTIEREIFIRNSVAAAIPYDPQLDCVVLIEQFRTGALAAPSPWLLEVVAGVSDEQDLSPEDIVHRELREESGLSAQKLLKICEYWVSPGGSNEYLYLYCAIVDASSAGGIHGLEHENEDIKVHAVSSQTAFQMLREGKVNNALSIIALQWLEANRDNLRK